MNQAPPRFLLGAALLFWAAIMDRMVPGIVCALLIEGAHWTRVRWNFGERASLVAWRLAVLFLTLAMVLVLMQQGSRITVMARVFTWLPVILIPIQFVQSYGISRTLSLGTFSMMVRRRKQHADKYGLPYHDIRFCFGHVYLCATLLAACLGQNANTPWFYVSLIALVSWAIISLGWHALGLATIVSLFLSAAGGMGGQKGLTALYRYATSGQWSSDPDADLNTARERTTTIGRLGKIKQSPEIVWRLIPEKGPLPRLLRVAAYNNYSSTQWSALIPRGQNNDAKDFRDLPELGNPANPEDPDDKFQICPPDLPDPSDAIDPSLSRFRLRGAISDRGGLLPLPANTGSLHRFAFEEFQRNSFGTFMLQPSQPVSDATVLWDDRFRTEEEPWESVVNEPNLKLVRPDLYLPTRETPALRRVADEIGLRNGTVSEKVEKLRDYFQRNFQYTRYNSVPRDLRRWAGEDEEMQKWLAEDERTHLAAFLLFSKKGHCEFFATAAALLLRETGVPTRYVSGFAVAEFDQKAGEAVIRGTHAHAWCRAWDAEARKWIDVDLTPPAWLGMETPRMSRFQGLQDAMKRLREDLLVWRDEPGHMLIITAVLLAPIIVGLGFVGRNLWRSRQQVEAAKKKRRGPVVLADTPLTALEKPARKILGARPPGLPLGPWLLQLSPRLTEPRRLAEALNLHQRLRFDPGESDPGILKELQRLVTEIRGELAKR